jgi:LysM repeat protein
VSGMSGRADKPRRLLSGIASDAARERSWKAFAGPTAFLLAATIAVVVARTVRHAPTPVPAPSAVVRSKAPITPPRRTYSVRPGDTLALIATKMGVPLGRIRSLNPGVQPTALFIGEKLRLR